jgi:hypothetical protein
MPPTLQLRECLIFDYDMDAYIAASSPDKDAALDFYFTTQVFSEGVPINCYNGSNWVSAVFTHPHPHCDLLPL